MSNTIQDLPTPLYVTDADGTNPLLVVADMVSQFEFAANRTLYPAQLERLLINLYAYRESLIRSAIQAAALQNLLAYANYPVLDYLGQLVGCTRLASVPATCTLQFNLLGTLTTAFVIAPGTQVGTTDGNWIFTTNSILTILPGQTSGTVAATATVPGSGGNGYLPGQVSVLLGGNALISSVANTNTTSVGDDQEIDEHYRTRIQAAPNQFSSAGPAGAYRYFALSADSSIVDAQVVTTSPGTVTIYVLTGPITVQPATAPNTFAIASSGVLNAVAAATSGDTVRPLNDTVIPSAVTEVDYQVVATVTLYNNAQASVVQAAVAVAANNLMLNLCATVSQDIVPSQWVTALSVYGVYSVDVTLTANVYNGASLNPTMDGRLVLSSGQWANCSSLSISYATSTENLPS